MDVQELIDQLQKYPKDQKVLITEKVNAYNDIVGIRNFEVTERPDGWYGLPFGDRDQRTHWNVVVLEPAWTKEMENV